MELRRRTIRLHRAQPLRFERLEDRCLLAAGVLDPDYGDDGSAILDYFFALDSANAIALQSDGSAIAVGSANRIDAFNGTTLLAVARFDTDGQLDFSFGDDGATLFEPEADSESVGNAVAIQDDDKIVVAGQLADGMLLVRYDPDGALDESFNQTGFVSSDLGLVAKDVVVQSDGKILIAGDAIGPFGTQMFLARFNGDGSLDSSFGDGGVRVRDLLLSNASTTSLAIANGKIVVASHGQTEDPLFSNIVVARHSEDGSFDSEFDQDGVSVTTLKAGAVATDVVIQPDGKVVVVGAEAGNLVLLRYESDGSPDPDFGEQGRVVFEELNPVPGGTTGGKGLIQPNGKIVVTASGGNDFVILRVNPDGSLDTSWNGVGKTVTDIDVTFDSSRALAIQEDGRVLVAGNTGGDWAIVRYSGDSLAWQNPSNRFDVNDDGNVVPLDVLRIINELNDRTVTNAQAPLPTTRPEGIPFFDVDGNGFLTPLDALAVINFLNEMTDPEAERDEAPWNRFLISLALAGNEDWSLAGIQT